MSEKINIMDIAIDKYTAKETMKTAVNCLESDPVSVFEIVTSDSLLQINSVPEVKEAMKEVDFVIAGEKTFLEIAGIEDKKYLQETEHRVFLKLYLKYLHKYYKRVYLLADNEEELKDFRDYLEKFYDRIQIAGALEVCTENRADDMIVNAVNGADVDCVLSVLSSPMQEEFILKNRNLLNANVWMGMGNEIIPVCKKKMKQNKVTQFILKRILQKEIEKSNKNRGI